MTTPIDLEVSQQVAKLIKTQSQNCWSNASKALLQLNDLRKAEYVEGWAVTRGQHQVIEHGWVELNSRIIDPTAPGKIVAYFAGLRFTKEEMTERIAKNHGELPIAPNTQGDEYDRYSTAFDQAWQSAQQFENKHSHHQV